MLRIINQSDRASYMEMSADFYASDAVLHPIPEKFREDTFAEIMSRRGNAPCYILELDGRIAGYMLLAVSWSQEAGGNTAWLEELYVRPEFRGRGLGKEALTFLHENVPAARYRIECEPENERAMMLYENFGFEVLPYTQLIKEMRK